MCSLHSLFTQCSFVCLFVLLSHMCTVYSAHGRRMVGFYWLHDILFLFPSEPYLITVINFGWISLATYLLTMLMIWEWILFSETFLLFWHVNHANEIGPFVTSRKPKLKLIILEWNFWLNLRQWSKQCMFMIHISIHEMHFADNFFHSIPLLCYIILLGEYSPCITCTAK